MMTAAGIFGRLDIKGKFPPLGKKSSGLPNIGLIMLL
jgi:hypothetical protein